MSVLGTDFASFTSRNCFAPAPCSFSGSRQDPAKKCAIDGSQRTLRMCIIPCNPFPNLVVQPRARVTFFWWETLYHQASPITQWVKNPPTMQETQEAWVWSLGWKEPLEKEMATHFSVLAWKSPWTEEPGGLQSTGLQRVRHKWATKPPPPMCQCAWEFMCPPQKPRHHHRLPTL